MTLGMLPLTKPDRATATRLVPTQLLPQFISDLRYLAFWMDEPRELLSKRNEVGISRFAVDRLTPAGWVPARGWSLAC